MKQSGTLKVPSPHTGNAANAARRRPPPVLSRVWGSSRRVNRCPVTTTDSNTTAPTQFLQGRLETYAYRRVGGGIKRPLICFQHFTGTLDNWDPAVTDPLASNRERHSVRRCGCRTVDR